MRNLDLAKDYLLRAAGRLKAVDTLLAERMWADVVRECQEVVELALKGLIRHCDIEVPRVHDVSEVLEENSARFPQIVREALEELMEISQELRRDRELAFYGSEDITPHSFYKEKHAKIARKRAGRVVGICREACSPAQRRRGGPSRRAGPAR
jgi:HEPN domain-containing protein